MSYLEELLPEFRKGAKIRCKGWGNDTYIEMNESTGVIINNKGRKYIFSYEDFTHSCWELFREPEPDWDYIIKNKCLCWFWNDNENGKYLGTIRFINKNDELPFVNWERGCAKNCRPVRKDEVTFYEDRKDE